MHVPRMRRLFGIRFQPPFKGSSFYETQLGRVVIQIRHADVPFPRVNLWIDRI